MKTGRIVCLAAALAGGVCDGQQVQTAQAAAGDGDFAIVSRGPHGRTWENSDGQRVEEIATGLHYWNGQTQEWTPSDPSFVVSADGTAFEASRILAPIRISENLDVIGAVTVTTPPPDNVTLRSTPIALALYDSSSGKAIILAAVTNGAGTNSTGILVDPRDVVFPNAFVGGGFAASVVFCVEPGRFTQDLVFTAFDPGFDPTVWGFAASSTNTLWLQIWTEFYAPPQPQMRTNLICAETNQAIRASMASPDLIDYTLDFGNYVFGLGKAYTAGTNAGPNGGVIVAKDFVSASGRSFLVESVKYIDLEPALRALPAPTVKTSSLTPPPRAQKTRMAALSVPPLREAKRTANEKIVPGRTAAVALSKPRGVVIDYVATPTSMSTPIIYSSDSTYYVSGTVYATGPVVMEGATFKFPSTSGSIVMEGPLTLAVTNYRGATFTAADDNTVGTTLSTNIWSHYSGNPTGKYYGNAALWLSTTANFALNNLRFCYMNNAIEISSETSGQVVSLSHLQMVDCNTGIFVASGSGLLTFNANNCLMAKVVWPFDMTYISLNGNACNCTFASCEYLCLGSYAAGSFDFENSIFSEVSELSSGPTPISLLGSYNGFYNSPTFGSPYSSVGSSPFQSAGAGNYYLPTNSPFLTYGTTNVGNTNVAAGLFSQLQMKTTQPPLFLTNPITANTVLTPQAQRDTNGTELGFHYDVIDYLAACTVSNATLLLTNGVAVGYYNNQGICLQNDSQLVSQGAPNQRNYLVYYGLVQEQPVNLWATNSAVAQSTPISPMQGISTNPSIFLRLTTLSAPQGETNLLNTADTGQVISGLTLRDCEIYGAGANWLMNESSNIFAIGFTNNVFHRTPIAISNNATVTSINNLFYGSSNIITNILLNGTNVTVTNTTTVSILNRSGTSSNISLNNAFYGVKVLLDNTNGMGYNAYLNGATNANGSTNSTDLPAANIAWLGGPLGAYYQAAGGPLYEKGSTSASNLDLYHYTVTTNNVVEGNNTVSIGYHYVALGTNGLPLVTNGVPDYLLDANGNGITYPGEVFWGFVVPTITSQPASQTVWPGTNVTFSVGVGGLGAWTYQWYYATNYYANGIALSGQTSSNLNLTNVQLTYQPIYYYVVVTSPSGAGSVTSSIATFWVAYNLYIDCTNGSDLYTGAATNQPFQTLTKAQSIRESMGSSVTITNWILPGDYFNTTMYLTGKTQWTPDDSETHWYGYGTNGSVRLWGGQPLTNWTTNSYNTNWWQASLPAYPTNSLNSGVNELKNWEVRMLYVDGAMASRAVFPTNGTSLLYPNTFLDTNLWWFNYNAGDIPPNSLTNWTNMEVMVDWSFNSSTFGVSNVNTNTGQIFLTFSNWAGGGGGSPWQSVLDIQTYRVYNTADGMSQPGQFYYDRSNQIVTYWPIGGKPPTNSQIIVPTTDRMWFLYGYAGGAGPHDVTFSNLTMKVNAVDRELEGSQGYLWDHMSLMNFYRVCGSSNITVENCTLGWCGGNAIGSDDGYVTNFNIINNEIGFCGNYGLDTQWAGPVLVSNNYIHDCGLITWQAPGVRVNTNAVVTQNNLFNFHTSAIADDYSANCVFSLNSISNCMFTEEDMGAYYQYYSFSNIIVSNFFQSVGTNYNNESANTNFPKPINMFRPAIYLDEQSSNTLISANQTIGCPTPSFLNLAFFNTISNNLNINTNSVAGYDCVRRYASSGTNDQSASNILADNWDYGVATNVYDAATGSTNAYSTISGNISYSTNAAGIAGLPAGFITTNSTFPKLILQQVPGGNGVQAYTPP